MKIQINWSTIEGGKDGVGEQPQQLNGPMEVVELHHKMLECNSYPTHQLLHITTHSTSLKWILGKVVHSLMRTSFII